MTHTHGVIDRFEDGTAVCVAEDNSVFTLPPDAVPEGAREGCHICCQDGLWRIDEQATESGKRALQKRMDALWK